MSIPQPGSSRNLAPVLKTHVHQQLDDTEFRATANSLAAIQDEIEKAKADKAKAMKSHNATISALEAKRAELSEVVKTGRKFIQVDARWVMNTPAAGRKTLMQVNADGNLGEPLRIEGMGSEDEQLIGDNA